MVHLLQDFELASGRFMPLMLFAWGAIAALVGLIVWLAGSALRRFSLLIIGALVGFAFALTIAELTFPIVSIIIAVTALNPYGEPQQLSLANKFGIILLLISILIISFDYHIKDKPNISEV